MVSDHLHHKQCTVKEVNIKENVEDIKLHTFSLGMLPVISTRPLSNFELTLSPDGTRVGNHRCSNLLDFNEIQTAHGFITDATKNPDIIGETLPYQYSVAMRSTNSLRFYRNLNQEACLWEFNSYYDMSELLNDCGGSIGTDGQVKI